ncbi:hypothetical protein ACFYU5_08710 [Nocardia aobensis]|uniref:Uncharacterized protein n=1 Tax=Nocardia aobensis TaxID=257277 RepID=A0ABW6NZ69_9NOCA
MLPKVERFIAHQSPGSARIYAQYDGDQWPEAGHLELVTTLGRDHVAAAASVTRMLNRWLGDRKSANQPDPVPTLVGKVSDASHKAIVRFLAEACVDSTVLPMGFDHGGPIKQVGYRIMHEQMDYNCAMKALDACDRLGLGFRAENLVTFAGTIEWRIEILSDVPHDVSRPRERTWLPDGEPAQQWNSFDDPESFPAWTDSLNEGSGYVVFDDLVWPSVVRMVEAGKRVCIHNITDGYGADFVVDVFDEQPRSKRASVSEVTLYDLYWRQYIENLVDYGYTIIAQDSTYSGKPVSEINGQWLSDSVCEHFSHMNPSDEDYAEEFADSEDWNIAMANVAEGVGRLRDLLDRAVGWGVIQSNPIDDMELPEWLPLENLATDESR